MKTVCIDVGNTRVKMAYFDNDTLVKLQICQVNNVVSFLTEFNPEAIGISTVSNDVSSIITYCEQNNIRFLVLNPQMTLNFTNLYATKQTQGMDRIAALAGAVSKYKNQPILVIDAGTCITCDFVNQSLEYVGGAISPGLSMRLKALHIQTQKLPAVELSWPEMLEGNSTQNSILSGVCYGVVDEIIGRIHRFTLLEPQTKVLLTGGDADFLAKHLKKSIFAAPNLVLEGINQLIKINV